MQNQFCDQMPDVRNAIVSGQWLPHILGHALECELCREFWIADCLHEQARVEACKAIPLNADVLWCKAQLQQDRLRSRRAAATIAAAQMFALLAGLIALLTVVAPFVLNPDAQLLRSQSPVVASLGSVATILFGVLFAIHTPRIGRWMRRVR